MFSWKSKLKLMIYSPHSYLQLTRLIPRALGKMCINVIIAIRFHEETEKEREIPRLLFLFVL